jgi:hypothetical protein
MLHAVFTGAAVAAAGTAAFTFFPMQAQAVTTAFPRPAVAVTLNPQIPDGYHWLFTGLSYPDTTAGRDACNDQGALEIQYSAYSYQCIYDDPHAGRINLWVELFR